MMSGVKSFWNLPRRGVALLTVLMSLVLIAALAAASRTSTGSGVRALERDIVSTKAHWQVEGCASVGVSVLNGLQLALGGRAWESLDSVFAQSRLPDVVRGCDLRVLAIGRVLGIQQYDGPALVRLLTAGGVQVSRAESLSAALMDWTDEDDMPRVGGAEADWYQSVNHPSPRNGAIRSLDEVELVRGFDGQGFLADTVSKIIGMIPARASIRHATFPVFRSLEGVSDLDAATMVRTRTVPPGVVLLPNESVGGSPKSVTLTVVPDGWELSARILGANGRPIAERWLRLGRTQTRIAVLEVRESR